MEEEETYSIKVFVNLKVMEIFMKFDKEKKKIKKRYKIKLIKS